uniref:Uncharacterized protein n=1 Tax=Siphoviridae sp. ctCIv11 TaxID=2827806 RepID=A0A8S5S2E8_9CAUD|nr:MAG TPA: hypothetical protein [Siphoviridae sp. ctCIv11]
MYCYGVAFSCVPLYKGVRCARLCTLFYRLLPYI